jgi:hypothetical protein
MYAVSPSFRQPSGPLLFSKLFLITLHVLRKEMSSHERERLACTAAELCILKEIIEISHRTAITLMLLLLLHGR